MQLCCARGPACRASWAPSRHGAGTARRSRASTRTRARDSTGAHAHARICAHIRTRPSPPARAPTRAARLSGCTRRAAVGGAGLLVEGGCRRASRWWAGRSCAARNQERRGVRRRARAGMPAAGQVFGPRGPVSVRWARSSRKGGAQMCPDAHAARMGGEATRKRVDGSRGARTLNRHRSPALEVSAGGVGGLDDPDASCRLQTALLSPCTGRIPSLRGIRGR